MMAVTSSRSSVIPVVTITAPDSVASEDGPSSAVLVVSRSGNTEAPLALAIEISGTATEGIDYEKLPRSITIPAGRPAIALLVKPIDDRLVEGDERVTITLKRASNYSITPPGEASVVILDNDRQVNIAPVVQLTSPTNEMKFVAPATITLRANASDEDGSVRRVEFFAGDHSLGLDTTSPYSVTWTSVPAGEYTLTARATDDAGVEVASQPVRIVVSAPASVGAFSAKINFQPATARVPEGYQADSGKVFGAKENGLTYGWSADNRANTRNRNSSLSPDQRYDTFAYLQYGGKSYRWEIAVPNGTYQVRVVAGDASSLDSVYGIDVEGVKALSGSPTNSKRWIEGTVTVKVDDGRLTVSNRSEARNNKICFIEIQSEAAANLSPKVLIASPADGSSFVAGADIALVAEAKDGDGAVKKVDFFVNDRLLASDETSPYSVTLRNATNGSFTITAKATDDRGAVTTSDPVRISVVGTRPPAQFLQVMIVSPVNGTVLVAPKTVSLMAFVSFSGSMPKTVEFFAGDKSLGAATNNPVSAIFADQFFRLTWTNPPPGSLTLTAKVTDSSGLSATSAPVKITIQASSSAAKLTITSPADGATFAAPATFTLHATAIDPNGYISQLEFFAGTNRIGASQITFIRAPDPGEPILHAFEWRNVAAGEYSVTAVAKDTKGATVKSPPVVIKVKPRALQSGFQAEPSLASLVEAGVKSLRHLPGGAVELNCVGEIGQAYAVEATTDLLNWTVLTTITPVDSAFQFTDKDRANVGQRFYRLRRVAAAQ